MRLLATALCVISVSAIAAIAWWRSANIGPVQRGADLAVAQGCLGCHGGPGVSPLLPRPFADLDDVDRATLREWILDGMPQRVRQDPERRQALEAAAIRMPAWRGRLSHAQVDDLVAYLRALAAADVPEDPEARKGHAVAERLGCFRCHGPGGRGAGPNPGSLKGYIPPWDGPDFAELVLDRRELREWIRDGRPQRLQANPLARFFLDRQAIRMPAFRGQVTEEEHRALEAYMGWLQRGSPATTTSTVQSTQQTVRVERSSTVRDMEQPSGSLVTWTKAIYALHAFSLLTGILGAATVVGAFLTGWPSIIAVILNYVKRGEARGSWIESHFRWQIRTFWFGLLWVVLCVLFVVATLGIGIIIAWLPMGLVGLWFIYRIVRGWVAVSDGRPMYT